MVERSPQKETARLGNGPRVKPKTTTRPVTLPQALRENKSAAFGYTLWHNFETDGTFTSCTFETFVRTLRKAKATAKVKEALPLMRAAKLRDDSRATRTAVIERIYGVEGDYDGEVITVEQAFEQLQAAGVRAVVVTTASHTDAAPRWRVFAPLRKPHAPDARRDLLARLNGALGGVLAAESDDPLRCYFWGRVNGVPYAVQESEGDCIDLLPDLDAGAVYVKRKRPDKASGNSHEAVQVTENRNTYIWEKHVALKREGLDGDVLVAALNEINERDCVPPLTADEMRRTCARKDGSYAEARTTAAEDFEKVPRSKKDASPLLVPYATVVSQYVPPSFLIQDVLPDRGLFTVTGHPGAGKTTAMLFLIQCCISGVPAGVRGLHVTRPIDSAAILCGDDVDGTIQRLGAYERENIFTHIGPHLLLMPRTVPLDPDVIDKLNAELDQHGVKVLLVDTGTAYAPSDVDDENAALKMQPYYTALRRLAKRRVVVVNGHPRVSAKENRYELIPRGSGTVLGTVDGNIPVWFDDATKIVHMQSSPKFRGRGFTLLFALRYVDSGYRDPNTDEPIVVPICEPIREIDRIAASAGRTFMVPLLRLYANADKPPGRDAVARALGCSPDTVDKTRQRAVDEKLLRKVAGKEGSLPARTSGFELTSKGREVLATNPLQTQ